MNVWSLFLGYSPFFYIFVYMCRLGTVLLILVSFWSFSQTTNGYFLPDSLIHFDPKYSINTTAGTCASPNGGMNSISAPPGSYANLQSGGYCNPGSYGNGGTVCWSFTPSQPSVNINSGYSQSGCSTISFGPFTLYKCSPSCSVVGTGLNFTVTPGQCYTWCMTFGTSGPPSCAVNDWCPYYQQFTPVPIELSFFAGSNIGSENVLLWKTATETNNDYFVLETSSDATNWNELTRVDGAGNSTKPLNYSYKHTNFEKRINYYRLKQVDSDRTFKYHGIVAVDNTKKHEGTVIRILNMLGQDVDASYEGIKIMYYSDGSVEKSN
jgi:hypothetical protein